MSMEPESRLNCCPPFAILPRFATPAVAEQNHIDGDGVDGEGLDGEGLNGEGVDGDGDYKEEVPCHAGWFLDFEISEKHRDL